MIRKSTKASNGKCHSGCRYCRQRTRAANRRESWFLSLLLLLFLPSPFHSNASTSAAAAESALTKSTEPLPRATAVSTTHRCVHSKNYDAYIIVTPFENSIGRAAAEELAKQLSEESSCRSNGTEKANSNTTSVICLVRCPPPTERGRSIFDQSLNQKSTEGSFYSKVLLRMRKLIHRSDNNCEKGNNLWLDQFFAASPIAITSSGTGSKATDFCFDPFGGSSTIRESAENCLNAIRTHLLWRTASEFFSAEENDGKIYTSHDGNYDNGSGGILSSTIHIRGILFNPYGCPPRMALDSVPSHNALSKVLRLSPLAEYKLVSIAVFLDAALASRTRTLNLPISDVLKKRESTIGAEACRNGKIRQRTKASVFDEEEHSPLRMIIVGTEAARGLPQMGIPVPDLEGATESSIRKKLSLDDSDGNGIHWERKYSEMNALTVLYLRALESFMSGEKTPPLQANERPAVASTTRGVSGWSRSRAKHLYLGIVSPGMTPESFNIAHVPEPARTVSFRWKLWLCNRRWIFGWLQRLEIAKPTKTAGALLAKALLNGPTDDPSKEHETTSGDTATAGSEKAREQGSRWDDFYPSGSFVGARSGTGGPLCEQSLLVYNATSNSVGPAAEDIPVGRSGEMEVANGGESGKGLFSFEMNHERINFLGNSRLQELVYRVMREIIDNSTS